MSGKSFAACEEAFIAAHAAYNAASAARDERARAGEKLGLHEIDPAVDLAIQIIDRTFAERCRASARNARRRAARRAARAARAD